MSGAFSEEGEFERKSQFLVFASEMVEVSHFKPGEVALIEADGVENAVLGYGMCIGRKDEYFLKHVYALDPSDGLFGSFCGEDGKPQIGKLEEFFGEHHDYQAAYVEHLRSAKPPTPKIARPGMVFNSAGSKAPKHASQFSEDMLLYIWDRSPFSEEVQVVALNSLPQFYVIMEKDDEGNENMRCMRMEPITV